MGAFVLLHLSQDRARSVIVLRQPIQVAKQVLLDLPLGFRHEAQADAVTQAGSQQPDRERAGIPERIEPADTVAEFLESLPGPGQVVDFLARCTLERRAHLTLAGAEGLPFVQRLRADLADVIDPDQRARMTT